MKCKNLDGEDKLFINFLSQGFSYTTLFQNQENEG